MEVDKLESKSLQQFLKLWKGQQSAGYQPVLVFRGKRKFEQFVCGENAVVECDRSCEIVSKDARGFRAAGGKLSQEDIAKYCSHWLSSQH